MWIFKDYDPYDCDPFNSRVIRKGEKTPSRPNLGGPGEEKANGKILWSQRMAQTWWAPLEAKRKKKTGYLGDFKRI